MSKLSIKIKIADREYPMKVEPEEEEQLRIAGKKINEKVRDYVEQFGIDDKQDILAMVAFDAVVKLMQSSSEDKDIKKAIGDKLSVLEGKLVGFEPGPNSLF